MLSLAPRSDSIGFKNITEQSINTTPTAKPLYNAVLAALLKCGQYDRNTCFL